MNFSNPTSGRTYRLNWCLLAETARLLAGQSHLPIPQGRPRQALLCHVTGVYAPGRPSFPTSVTGQLTWFQTWTAPYSLGLSRETPDTFPQRARACRKVRHPATASARGTSAPWRRITGGHQPPPVPGINRHATTTEWSTCRPHVLNIHWKSYRLRQKLQAGLFPSQLQLGATPGKADTTTPTDRLEAQNQVGQLQPAIDSPQAHSPPDPLGQEFPPAPTPAGQEGERNKKGRPV